MKCRTARRVIESKTKKGIPVRVKTGVEIVAEIDMTKEVKEAFRHVQDCPRCRAYLHFVSVNIT